MTNIVARENGKKSEPQILPPLEALSLDERRRLEGTQGLESHRSQSRYRESETEAAATLSLSVGHLKRLVRQMGQLQRPAVLYPLTDPAPRVLRVVPTDASAIADCLSRGPVTLCRVIGRVLLLERVRSWWERQCDRRVQGWCVGSLSGLGASGSTS